LAVGFGGDHADEGLGGHRVEAGGFADEDEGRVSRQRFEAP